MPKSNGKSRKRLGPMHRRGATTAPTAAVVGQQSSKAPCPSLQAGEELDIFSATAEQIGHVRTYTTTHNNEVSQVSGQQQMIFVLKSQCDWQAFDRSMFEIELQLTKADGTPMGDADMVSVVDNVGHSLLKEINFYVGNDRVYAQERHDYVHYIQQRLTLAADALNTWPQLHAHYEDQHMHFNTFTDQGNSGFKSRRTLFKGGRTVKLYVRPNCFPFTQSRLMPAFVDKRFVITRNTDDFLLLGAADDNDITKGAKLKVKRIALKMCNVELKSSVQTPLLRGLKTGKGARYPFRMAKYQAYSIDAATLHYRLDQHSLCFPGMPHRILFALVTQRALHGDRQENPFRMSNHRVVNFQVTVNEHDYFADGGLATDFAKGDYSQLYLKLMQDLNYYQNEQTGPSLSYREFDNDQTFWSVNIVNRFPEAINGLWPSDKLTVAFSFAQPTTEILELVCYPVHDNEVQILQTDESTFTAVERAAARLQV